MYCFVMYVHLDLLMCMFDNVIVNEANAVLHNTTKNAKKVKYFSQGFFACIDYP